MLIAFILPLLAAILCISVGGVPVKQGMMLSIGKPQVIISICLLVFLICGIAYCLIMFARTKFDEQSVLSLVANQKPKYFATSLTSPSENNSENEESGLVNDREESKKSKRFII